MKTQEKTVVKVANGQQMVNEEKIDPIILSIQHFHITTEAYVLVLARCDVVLGIAWLQTLRTISLNFNELSMKFNAGRKTVQFKGLSNSKLIEIGGRPRDNYGENKGVVLQLLQEKKNKSD